MYYILWGNIIQIPYIDTGEHFASNCFLFQFTSFRMTLSSLLTHCIYNYRLVLVYWLMQIQLVYRHSGSLTLSHCSFLIHPSLSIAHGISVSFKPISLPVAHMHHKHTSNASNFKHPMHQCSSACCSTLFDCIACENDGANKIFQVRPNGTLSPVWSAVNHRFRLVQTLPPPSHSSSRISFTFKLCVRVMCVIVNECFSSEGRQQFEERKKNAWKMENVPNDGEKM